MPQNVDENFDPVTAVPGSLLRKILHFLRRELGLRFYACAVSVHSQKRVMFR